MTSPSPDFQLFSSLRFDPILLHSEANTSLAIGASPFYMLSLHRDRILQAALHFNWQKVVARLEGADGLLYLQRALEATIDVKSTTCLRVRVLLDHNGDITVETNETSKVPLGNLFPSHIPPPGSSTVKVSPLTGGALAVSADDAERLESSIRIPPQVNAWTVMIDPEKTQPSSFTTYKTTRRDFYTNARDRVGIESMTEPKEVLIISNTDDGIMEGSLTSVFFWRNGNWVTPPVASGGQAGTTRRWYLEKGFCKEEPVNIKTLVDGEECWISNGVRGLVWGKIKL